MSLIAKAPESNRTYAKTYNPALGKPPAPKIAVVTCMDPRLSDLPGILGMPQSDIDVIRTGGLAVTEDVLGELIVSTRVLGSREILLLNHTGCGFTTFTDDAPNAKLSASTQDASPAPMRFFSFKDPEGNTPSQIKTARSHPWTAKDIPVRGVIFDVTLAHCAKSKHFRAGSLRESQSPPPVHSPRNSCLLPKRSEHPDGHMRAAPNTSATECGRFCGRCQGFP